MQELIDAIASLPVGSIVSGRNVVGLWPSKPQVSFVAERTDKGYWLIESAIGFNETTWHGTTLDVAELASRCHHTRGIPSFTIAIR